LHYICSLIKLFIFDYVTLLIMITHNRKVQGLKDGNRGIAMYDSITTSILEAKQDILT